MCHFVITRQRERISIHVAKVGNRTSPNRRLAAQQQRLLRRLFLCLCVELDSSQPRRRRKSHSPLRPLLKSRRHIVRQKHNLRRPPNQFRFLRFRLWLDQRQHCGPIRRRHSHPPFPRLQLRVKCHAKPELLHVKLQAAFLVADVHVHAVHAQMHLRPDLRGFQTSGAQSSSHRPRL